MNMVIIESPFSGDEEANTAYACECLLDSLRRGEASFASHLLYTRVLNDKLPNERKQGIEAGLRIAARADLTAVYVDRGISEGMKLGIAHAEKYDRPVVYRRLYPEGL